MDRRTTTAFAGASALLDRGVRDQLRLGLASPSGRTRFGAKIRASGTLALYVAVAHRLDSRTFSLGLGQIDDLGDRSSRGCFIIAHDSSPGWRPDMSSTNICGTWVWAPSGEARCDALKKSSRPDSTFAVSVGSTGVALSDGASRRTATSGRTRQRGKGAPRGGRHGLTRPAATVREESPLGAETTVVAAPTRARRRVAMPAPRAVELTREQEFAYIRSDMRRLFIIAGGLLALMLILLIVVSR